MVFCSFFVFIFGAFPTAPKTGLSGGSVPLLAYGPAVRLLSDGVLPGRYGAPAILNILFRISGPGRTRKSALRICLRNASFYNASPCKELTNI
jgi:hypothetical protein